jgi:hypothetical protein
LGLDAYLMLVITFSEYVQRAFEGDVSRIASEDAPK